MAHLRTNPIGKAEDEAAARESHKPVGFSINAREGQRADRDSPTPAIAPPSLSAPAGAGANGSSHS